MWVRRFVFFHNVRHPAEMAEPEINAFLTHLAVKERVSPSTQNQALSALLFLYRVVLKREIGELGDIIRARRAKRLPVVMTREEVRRVIAGLRGDKWIAAYLMYGAGLRLMECLRLRVQDIDFGAGEIMVRDGKGFKDRPALLPDIVRTPLLEHLEKVRRIHQRDVADGFGRVVMPYALDRKYPGAAWDWKWQFVFPQANRWVNHRTGEEGRHHVDESSIQKSVHDCGAQGGDPQEGDMPHVPAFFRDASPRERIRHPHRPGAARSQGRPDDHGVHARPQPRRQGSPEPGGYALTPSPRGLVGLWC